MVRRLSLHGKYSPGLYGLPHMGEVIADYRRRQGYTQEALAIICGVDKQTVAYWESHMYLADMNRRILLCKILAIPPALLGLTWRSVVDDGETAQYIDDFESLSELLAESCYDLYADVFTFFRSTPDRYSPQVARRFLRHLSELERIVKRAPVHERARWITLLSHYYQHAAFIAQHHCQDERALSYIDRGLEAATLAAPRDQALEGLVLYRRARLHIIQQQHQHAREDSQAALSLTERTNRPIRGACYLLASEIHALYAEGDEHLKSQCRRWHDWATDLLYKGRVEEDDSFLWFNLYAVHHERAKVLMRFAFAHSTDQDLVDLLKDPHRRANTRLMAEARSELDLALQNLEEQLPHQEAWVDYTLTEVRFYLLQKEIEEAAQTAIKALVTAQRIHSYQCLQQIAALQSLFQEVAPKNPYVRRLEVLLHESKQKPCWDCW
jgi:transcriptional regulator with XRE-family HTH domain